MLTNKIAKRYAQGLLDFSKESNQVPSIYGEMKDIIKVMSNAKDLQKFLDTPFIDAKKKLNVVKEVFKSFSPLSQNFLNLIVKQGREAHLKDIAQEFINKVDAENGVQKVHLVTATQLSNSVIENILSSTSLVKSSQYELKLSINPDIVGGYILRVGDQQIDASVKSKLNQLKKIFN